MVNEMYFDFLCREGQLTKVPCVRYMDLWRLLHQVPFHVEHPRDENRIGDAMELRRRFTNRRGLTLEDDRYIDVFEMENENQVSVFEVLLAFAMRIDLEYVGTPGEKHPDRVMLELIKNLGIDKFDGTQYGESFVRNKLNRWMYREYNIRGIGGLFPVRQDSRDQRLLEMWDQMLSYVHENYGD